MTSTVPVDPREHPTLVAVENTALALCRGQEIDERYRIETRLGAGAMGEVYRARHLRVGRPVAIKVLASEWATDHTMIARFREEARAASAIGHPNIVGVIDAGSLPDGRPYFVMELLEGRSLATVLRQESPLETRRGCSILLAIARAIAAAHGVGVVHRDLKPENVMVTRTSDGEHVKVVDFGIAHAVDPLRARITEPGTVMGTPEYMAPEQVRAEPATPAFDLYALGVIAFETLGGRVPIQGTTSLEIMTKKTFERSPSLGATRPDLPSDLVAVIDACLEREPEHRPASAREVVEVLERTMGHQGIVLAQGMSRSRAWILGSAIAIVAVMALLWALDAGGSGTSEPSATPVHRTDVPTDTR